MPRSLRPAEKPAGRATLAATVREQAGDRLVESHFGFGFIVGRDESKALAAEMLESVVGTRVRRRTAMVLGISATLRPRQHA